MNADGTGGKPLVANWEIVPNRHFKPPSDLDTMPLKELAKKINASLCAINSSISIAKKHAGLALSVAIKTGQYLEASRRKCEKGTWGKWREEHCPELSQATAYRYMSLARKFSHVISDGPVQTLRQAYIAIGLMSESRDDVKPSPNPSVAPLTPLASALAGLNTWREFIQSLHAISVDAMIPEYREQLAHAVAETMSACTEIRKKLASSICEITTDTDILSLPES
ncbi:MAG: DUF3102 domain-containing protein [Chthoniobacter sp.]|nr:DUF3102 domain-containing protein [Chthoniobacter sp.]